MRKIVSAILICILFFNLFGYRFVADYLQQKSDQQLEARLDVNQYDESQLIELKVPIHLAYQTTWSDFERYDGEIKMKGILYKYVKRKVANDTLVLMCIPNHTKMQLQSAKDDFFKNANDLSQSSTSKKSDNSKSLSLKKQVSEYDEHSFALQTNSISDLQIFIHNYQVKNLINSPHTSPAQPPDLAGA